MKCLKCGEEIPEEEAFCMECLLDAQRYPVDPGSAVFIPKRQAAETPKKAPRRRILTSEDQIRILRRRVRVQWVILALLAAAVATLVYPAFEGYAKDHPKLGQNYSAVTQPTVGSTVP